MTHRWSVDLESVGNPSAPQSANALALRNAYIAAAHGSPSATDDAVWNGLMAACSALCNTVDPAGTALRRLRLHAQDAHPSAASLGCGLSLTLTQPGIEATTIHSWEAFTSAALTAPEILLARNMMIANAASKGVSASTQDTLTFDALIVAGAALLSTLDPGAGAANVDVSLSASVSVGSLAHISVSLSVSARPLAIATLTPIAVLKPSASTSNVIALADILGLAVTLDPLATYRFDYNIIFRSAALTTGIGLAINGPISPGLISYVAAIPFAADGAGEMFHGAGTAYNDTTLSTAVPAINTDYVARIFGVIRTGAAGGALIPRFRSEVAASLVTVQQGSNGIIYRLG